MSVKKSEAADIKVIRVEHIGELLEDRGVAGKPW